MRNAAYFSDRITPSGSQTQNHIDEKLEAARHQPISHCTHTHTRISCANRLCCWCVLQIKHERAEWGWRTDTILRWRTLHTCTGHFAAVRAPNAPSEIISALERARAPAREDVLVINYVFSVDLHLDIIRTADGRRTPFNTTPRWCTSRRDPTNQPTCSVCRRIASHRAQHRKLLTLCSDTHAHTQTQHTHANSKAQRSSHSSQYNRAAQKSKYAPNDSQLGPPIFRPAVDTHTHTRRRRDEHTKHTKSHSPFTAHFSHTLKPACVCVCEYMFTCTPNKNCCKQKKS